MDISGKAIIYFCFIVGLEYMHAVSTACPPTVHPGIKGFGPGCRYRCNCVNNEQCNEVTGDCPTGCLHGWMGPACQYRNYALLSTDQVQHDTAETTSEGADKAIDGDVSTCSRTGLNGQPGQQAQQWWRAELESELYIGGLVIKIPESETGKFRGFTVEIGNMTDNYDICYKHGSDEDGEAIMDVNCVHPIVGSAVRIQLAENVDPPLVLCEIEIYGGRLVSFNKPTSLKKVVQWPSGSYWSSSYAVDGRQMLSGENQDTESERTCTATKGGNQPTEQWWNVRLESVFIIQGISFFGRLDKDQYSSYSVLVNDSDTSGYQNIFMDGPPNDISAYNPKSKNYTEPIPGSIVRVQRSSDTQILTICEFEVFAECPLGKCGWECNITCMCSNQTTGQDKIRGICPHGCSGRWSGSQGGCDIECPDTKWGPYCNNTCGQCKNNTLCSAANGRCPDSCRPGWIPPLCVNACNDGDFGPDCNSTCGNCKNDEFCDKETGQCGSGCKQGYKPPLCIDECDPGFYGDNCNDSCGNCRNGSICDHATGGCPDGCDPGYQGTTCIMPCDPGSYGLNCLGRCGSCRDEEGCNATTGNCSNGCNPGWLTEFCKTPCDNGFYGEQCIEKCGFCLNDQTCSHTDGSCPRCAPGYHGAVCKTECDGGSYGQNCDPSCGNCAGNEHCNRTNGACPLGCAAGYSGDLCTVKDSDTTATETIVGAAVGVVAVLAAAIAVVVICKRRRSKRHTKSKSENGSPTFANTELRVTPNERLKNTERIPSGVQDAVYCNEANEQPNEGNTIKVSRLRAFSHAAVTDPSSLYSEFQELPYGLTDDASEARAIQYKPKNRYKDMYPYNMNRVILPEIPDNSDSTYINASYINGYDVPRKYIAAQGALETTVEDIWRMVWSEKISVIVMLTNCFELGRLKCVQYWSDEGSKVYADICASIASVEEYTDFKVKTFQCTKIESGERRTVLQFHYTAWPDKDVPDTALSLVQFWRTVRGHAKSKRLPWMVHCSAGVGRTGTFIALDYLYDEGKSENKVNVKDGVYTLRQQRLNMVQTKHQYVYLHEAVAEALDPIGTVCKNETFHGVYRSLFTEDGTPTQALRDEFDILCKATGMMEAEEAIYSNESTVNARNADANLPANKEKSRNLEIIPDDLHRPRLGMAVQGRNDFINAVYVPTYRQKDRLILTQFPLSKTTVDFVRMLWEFDIATIVLLDEAVSGEGVYWPSKEVPKMISPFTAEHVSERKEEYYTLRKVRYTHNKSEQSKEIRIFHFRSWPFTSSIPVNTASMLRLISDVENESNDTKLPLTAQCFDGAEKSGLFCVLCCVLERMKTDREVAIAETVRQVRLRRKQVINNFDQYAYCYRIVRDYLESSEIYANVM